MSLPTSLTWLELEAESRDPEFAPLDVQRLVRAVRAAIAEHEGPSRCNQDGMCKRCGLTMELEDALGEFVS